MSKLHDYLVELEEQQEELINELVIQLSSNKTDNDDINALFKDMDDLINDGEAIEVKCQFCNKAYTFEIEELKEIRNA